MGSTASSCEVNLAGRLYDITTGVLYECTMIAMIESWRRCTIMTRIFTIKDGVWGISLLIRLGRCFYYCTPQPRPYFHLRKTGMALSRAKMASKNRTGVLTFWGMCVWLSKIALTYTTGLRMTGNPWIADRGARDYSASNRIVFFLFIDISSITRFSLVTQA